MKIYKFIFNAPVILNYSFEIDGDDDFVEGLTEKEILAKVFAQKDDIADSMYHENRDEIFQFIKNSIMLKDFSVIEE